MSVTWDPDKNRTNERKHGVSFEEAGSVLDDDWRMEEPDEAHSHTEQRTRTVGMSRRARVLLVITALDGYDPIRIISARRATKRERHAYEHR